MAKPSASDELWEIMQPLLPAPKPRRFRNWGRQLLDDRKALTGIPPYQVRGRLWWRPCPGAGSTGSSPAPASVRRPGL